MLSRSRTRRTDPRTPVRPIPIVLDGSGGGGDNSLDDEQKNHPHRKTKLRRRESTWKIGQPSSPLSWCLYVTNPLRNRSSRSLLG
jgi:hypothetical protein